MTMTQHQESMLERDTLSEYDCTEKLLILQQHVKEMQRGN
jgi:hypothetical protein